MPALPTRHKAHQAHHPPAGFWELNSPGQNILLSPPYRLVLTGASGQTLVKQLQSLQSQDLGINF